MTRKKNDYQIGYGKPPDSGRFKKGTSGNLKGRPKGARNFATDVEQVLSAPVSVMENGRKTKVSSQMAALMRLRESALNGNLRATAQLLALAQLIEDRRAASGAERALSASEEEILQRYGEELLRQRPSGNVTEQDGEADAEP